MRKSIGAMVILGLLGIGYMATRPTPANVDAGALSVPVGAGSLLAMGATGAMPASQPATATAAAAAAAEAAAAAPVPRSGLDAPGSEGYGPHVIRALESGSPREAEAARWKLQRCKDGSRGIDGILSLRAKEADRRKAEIYSQMLADERAMLRACQTVTPEIAALEPRLQLKAARGALFGAASSCLNDHECVALAGAEMPALRAARLTDARQGDFSSIQGLLYDNEHRVEGEERMIHVLAYRRIVQDGHEQGMQAFFSGFEGDFRRALAEKTPVGMLLPEDLTREFIRFVQEAAAAPLKLEGTPSPEAQRQADAIVAAYLQRKNKR